MVLLVTMAISMTMAMTMTVIVGDCCVHHNAHRGYGVTRRSTKRERVQSRALDQKPKSCHGLLDYILYMGSNLLIKQLEPLR